MWFEENHPLGNVFNCHFSWCWNFFNISNFDTKPFSPIVIWIKGQICQVYELFFLFYWVLKKINKKCYDLKKDKNVDFTVKLEDIVFYLISAGWNKPLTLKYFLELLFSPSWFEARGANVPSLKRWLNRTTGIGNFPPTNLVSFRYSRNMVVCSTTTEDYALPSLRNCK